MKHDSVETIDITPTLRIRVEQDTDAQSPENWSNLGQIAYCSSREYLGTENVSRDRLDEISKGLRDGSLIGLPVYAYVHSGSTIRTYPFDCPWDSGQSGLVYCTKEKAIEEFGKKVLTTKAREMALSCLRSEVEAFDQYLRGDVYGVIVERVKRDEDGDEVGTEVLASCWGFYGLDYALEEAKRMAEEQAAEDLKEAAEAAYWSQRDVVTA